jgi:hypothetical protein
MQAGGAGVIMETVARAGASSNPRILLAICSKGFGCVE